MLSFLATFEINPVSATTTSTFGNSGTGYIDTNDANAQSVSYFKCSASGQVTDIMAYVDGASSGKAIAALYAVSGGSASTLLAQSNGVNLGTSYSWVDFPMSSSYSVVSGVTYGLAIMGNVAVNLNIVSGTGQRDHNAVSSYAGGFANPFGSIWGSDGSGAMAIYAVVGGSSSPSPTQAPTSTPTPTQAPAQVQTQSANLEPLSAFYPDMNAWGYASLDYSTTHNGDVSIRVGPDYVRGTREVDGAWIGVNPGDHIVFSAWIKTAQFTSSDVCPGGRIGMDFYISTPQGGGIALNSDGTSAGPPSNAQNFAGTWRVTWGHDWTLITWDVYVPTTYYTQYSSNSGIHSCAPVQITSLVPWFDTRAVTDNAYSWFSDTSLYVNP